MSLWLWGWLASRASVRVSNGQLLSLFSVQISGDCLTAPALGATPNTHVRMHTPAHTHACVQRRPS